MLDVHVSCVFTVSKTISATMCEPVTDSGCGFLCTYPPCTEVNLLTEMENKLNQREVNDCRCVCACECVCAGNCGWEEKFNWKAVFTPDLLDKNVGVVFLNILRD